MRFGAARRGQIKIPPCQRVQGGSQKSSGKLDSSLAVFYVEQVALNRHVRRNRGYTNLESITGDCQGITLAFQTGMRLSSRGGFQGVFSDGFAIFAWGLAVREGEEYPAIIEVHVVWERDE